MENLNTALNDLRTTIVEEGFAPNLIEEIAADWEIKPALLARKFEEKYGQAPANYRALPKFAMDTQRLEKAMEAAIALEKKYIGGTVPDVCGRGFKSRDTGEDFIAVTISTRGLIAIRLEDGKVWRFGKGRSAIATARSYNLI